MQRWLGITLMVMALVIAIVPQFTTCESQGRSIILANGASVPMKCLWTARAELVVSIPLLLTGALMIASRRRESLRNLAILGAILGVLVLLIPTVLIGVCQTLMTCHTLMKPVLLITGSLVTAAGLVGLWISRKASEC
jgi:hypothetical protein